MTERTTPVSGVCVPPNPAVSTFAISDDVFDGLFPDEVRSLSRQHWTPIAVAERAAQILSAAGATRVLDVGSGPGKFCIVGALATRMAFHGIEQRQWLVTIARALALRLGAHRAHFEHTNMMDVSFELYDGFYLYNPFCEQITHFAKQIDTAIDRSRVTYDRYVLAVTQKLAATRPGATVVIYNGFGGTMPPCFAKMGTELAGSERLEIWTRR